MDKAPLLEVENLRFRYPDGAAALAGVNFRLEEGETVALLGPNGAGKTTFLHLLVGLLNGQGRVQVVGRPVDRANIAFARSQIGLLFQDSNDQLFMPTVAEDIAFGPANARYQEHEVLQRVRQALATVGLSGLGERPPHHLSAGQKRLAALAGILAMEPKMILLDEPATFLDPPARAHLIETLRALPQAKIVVTHDISLARALAQRAVFFEKGRIVAEGSVDEVVQARSWL
ncbi:MAG: ABC transporter ATP-binding protein [Acidobacteria bacterium]|nr:ABC transporter ATP-binding protein [Acidobacteriota bacterium]MDA1235339.1 ABC transporter ATP-binding protein [Acidobacteriota bacterium]